MFATLCFLFGCLAILFSSTAATPFSKRNGMRFDPANFTVGAVRAAHPLWSLPLNNYTYQGMDLDATVTYATDLIQEASNKGAGLLAFPELYFPGYPKYSDANAFVFDLVDHSLHVGDSLWQKLVEAVRHAAIYVSFGFSESDGHKLYMAQALLSPEGEVLIHRRKLRPSGGERTIWSDGDMDGLQVVDTPYGKMGMLECWEHFHPSMTYNMQVQLEDIHIGAWPYTPNYGATGWAYWQTAEVNLAAARTYAINSGAVTVAPSIGKAVVFSNLGLELAEVQDAEARMFEQPVIYAAVNTTTFRKKDFDVNGEQSWGVLQQITEGFPGDVPKSLGTFVLTKEIPISNLLSAARNGSLYRN